MTKKKAEHERKPKPARPANFADLTGKRFGMLTVVSFFGIRKTRSTWKCLCECGGEAVVNGSNLTRGSTRSCGCLNRNLERKYGLTHGLHSHPIYRTWQQMKARCSVKTHPCFSNYGGRGIVVCERWLNSVENFLHDMGPRPSLNHSIDRIDNDGNYEPDNCRWATTKEQSRNKRSNVFLEHKGITKCIAEWEIEFGLGHGILGSRLKRGWSVEDAITRPVKHKQRTRSKQT